MTKRPRSSVPNGATPQPRPEQWTPVLSDVACALESLDEPEARVERALESVGRFVPYECCALLEEYPVLARRVSVGCHPGARTDASPVDRPGALLELLSERAEAQQASVQRETSTGRAHLAVPILRFGETAGMLFVEHREARYDETHLALLSIVAAQIGAYLSTLQALAERDRAESERVRLAEQRGHDLELLQMFMGMVGHDLRNPLNAIEMSAERLERGVGQQLARSVRRIRSSAARMERMVGQLLDLTRIRLGDGIPIQKKQADLEEICARVIDELQVVQPGVRLRLQRQADDVTGHWDRDRLSQVASNLIGNAIEHAEGQSEVLVRLSATDDWVALRVRNAGAISPELLPELFEPFRRARSASGSGLGLGLFITKRIVEAHGGTIRVASSPSEGTTVTVELPRGKASANPSGPVTD